MALKQDSAEGFRSISSRFCISMDENGTRMRRI